MLYVDTKFLGLLSPQLERFKVKQTNPYLANFRCPICGDSKRNKYKARGFAYTKNNELFYKCHNCGAGTTLGGLLRQLNTELYQQYKLEKYTENNPTKTIEAPVFKKPIFKKKSVLESNFKTLDELEDTHPAIVYCKDRQIPVYKYKELYFCESSKELEILNKKYEGRINSNDPRIILPYFDKDNNLIGATCRAISADVKLRYVAMKFDEDSDLIYNSYNIKKDEVVYVVEGPIDSLFIENCVAASTSDLTRVSRVLPDVDVVLVFDNQPRNSEIIKLMKQACDKNYKMVVWPETIDEKDINEMIQAGRGRDEIKTIIDSNTHQGLALKLAINKFNKT